MLQFLPGASASLLSVSDASLGGHFVSSRTSQFGLCGGSQYIELAVRSSAERVMPEYRFYRIDRRRHRLGPPEVADCANDDEAVAHAKQILTGYVLEVCQADRMVKHVEPEI